MVNTNNRTQQRKKGTGEHHNRLPDMQNHVAYAEQAEGIQPDFGKGKWKQAAQPSQCTGQERVHGDGVKLGEPGHCPGTESQQAGDSGQNQAGCKNLKERIFFFCPFRRLVLGGGGF